MLQERTKLNTKITDEVSSGRKNEYSINDTTIKKTERILYDATTGVKISKEIETQTCSTKTTQKTEEWAKIKSQRIMQLAQFKQMSLETAKTKSQVFAIYAEEFHKALIALEKLRLKLNLSYSNSKNLIWNSIEIVQLFVFGVTNKAFDNYKVPDYFQYLICCWTYMELVCCGCNQELVEKIASDYFLDEDDLKLEQKNWFLIRPEMIAKHTLGCLLFSHLPHLNKIMRTQIKDNFVKSYNFPILKNLNVPERDRGGYETVVFNYSFTLYEPKIKDFHKWNIAKFCLKDGQCAISVDGPLTKLFQANNLSQKITDLFEKQALTGPN